MFAPRLVVLEPGCERPYDEAEWRDAIVLVASGEVDLEGLSGRSLRFGGGDLLWLASLPLRALVNHGDEPVLLVAISREERVRPTGRIDRHKLG
jgi:hypothetical protein